jgi:ferredoxin
MNEGLRARCDGDDGNDKQETRQHEFAPFPGRAPDGPAPATPRRLGALTPGACMALHDVTIESTGERFRCSEDDNLLAAMERARCHGIPVGCRNGGCGACKVRITSGRFRTRKMNRAVVSAGEEAAGCVLACKTYPLDDLSVQVLGRVWQTATPPKNASFSFGFAKTTPPTNQPDKET